MPELGMLDLGEWFYIFKPQIHKTQATCLPLPVIPRSKASVKTCITSFRPSPIPNLEILKEVHWLDVGGSEVYLIIFRSWNLKS